MKEARLIREGGRVILRDGGMAYGMFLTDGWKWEREEWRRGI